MKIEASPSRPKPTPEQWPRLSPVEQREIWPALTPEEQRAMKAAEDTQSREIAATRAPAATVQRPASALACFIAAWLSLFASIVYGTIALKESDLEIGVIASSCLAGAALWWALGDIVSLLAKISARR